MAERIIIIGAGVIGAASALALQQDDHDILLVDREAPCAGASFGNAGVIVNDSCAPTAMPGILFDVIRMIGQPLPPVSIRPAYFHKILPWLIRFIWQSRTAAVTNNAIHLYALSKHAVKSWRQLIDKSKLSSVLEETGWLKVYELQKTFNATSKARVLMDAIGTQYQVLTGEQIRDLEPNLAPIFNVGLYQEDCLRIVNPHRLVAGMVDLFVSRGGEYRQFSVEMIKVANETVSLSGPGGVLVANRVLIAAGAWSRTLARLCGDNVPLDTERGYHLMLPESTRSLLNGPVVNGESSFVLSPMEMGIRISGQIEFAGLTATPNYARMRSLLPAAKRMLPDLDTHEESVWMGCRPSLPDSLPVLGFASNTHQVLYAFGHQHLGMTLGAITGLVIADLVAGRKPVMDVFPYRPNRF